jgi:hypothetical protein
LYLNACQNTVKSNYFRYKIILHTFKNSSKKRGVESCE